MSYLLGFLAVAAFAAGIHFLTEMSMKQKVTAAVTLLLIILGAIAFNEYADKQAEHVRDIQLRYEQGKTVHCNGIDVNESTFSFSVGTHTFIGREGSEHYSRMFKAENCQQ